MKKKWILISSLVYGFGIVVLIFFYVIQPEDYFSSPTESRDLYGFKEESSVGILEKESWSIDDAPPASAVMSQPTLIRGEKSQFVLNWESEIIGPEVPQAQNWTTALEGDDELELVAFATWVPQAEDDVSEEADWQIIPEYYDAKTLELLSGEKLTELGLPDEFRKMEQFTNYRTGKIRLIFRAPTMEYVRFIGGDGGDRRTSAGITYDLDDLSDEVPNSGKIGEWVRYDMALLTWHDSPVKFHVKVLTGEPQLAELKQETGQQVAFGDLQRIQWLTTGEYFDRKTDNLEDFVPAKGVEKEVVEKLFTGPKVDAEGNEVTEDTSQEETQEVDEVEETEESQQLPQEGALIGAAIGSGTSSLIEGSQPESNTEEVFTEIIEVPELTDVYQDFSDLSLPTEFDPHFPGGFGYSSSGFSPSRPQVETAVWFSSNKDEDDEPRPVTMVRVGSDEYLDHLGWIREDGSVEWEWSHESDEGGFELRSTQQMKDLSKPLKLVFLPKVTELTFEIGGMPGLPNSRDVEDLFDITIPRLTLPENPESAEDRLFQFVSVATQNGWELENIWDDDPPPEIPGDRTFRNMTPQQLLDWYLKVTQKAHIKYDEAEHVLKFNEETPSILRQIQEWISEKASYIGF